LTSEIGSSALCLLDCYSSFQFFRDRNKVLGCLGVLNLISSSSFTVVLRFNEI
jgi:hypothetical protein